MGYSMFPMTNAVKALFILAFPLVLKAQPIPSATKTHESQQKSPGITVTNKDTWTDYVRDGKVVYRLVERAFTVKHDCCPEVHGITHIIEFVANGRVILSSFIDKGNIQDYEVTCGYPAHIECLPGGDFNPETPQPNGRAFRVCVPKLDYFEYVEVVDNKIVIKPIWETIRERDKKRCIQEVERGYIDKEREGR